MLDRQAGIGPAVAGMTLGIALQKGFNAPAGRNQGWNHAGTAIPPILPPMPTVTCGNDRDTIELLVRVADDIPRRGVLIAPGSNVHTIGAWPEHGIEGTQLGPNKNSKHW